MEGLGAVIRKAGIGDQGSGKRDQGTEALRSDHESSYSLLNDRVRELEAENARLKRLVGELLVTNQLLRECQEQAARSRQASQ